MSEKTNLNRREATGRIIGLLALATGMTVAQVSSALGQWTPRKPDSSKYKPRKPVTAVKTPTVQPTTPINNPARTLIVDQKSNDAALAKIKVALENQLTVFENEYGRLTPIRQIRAEQVFAPDKVPGDLVGDMMGVCATNFGSAAGNIGVVNLGSCDNVNTCNAQELQGPCDGTNTCTGGQDCGDMSRCDENTCTGGQDCGKFNVCENVNSQSVATVDILNSVANDLYVQLLMKEFNVTTTAALADAINTHFTNIAAGNESIWPPK